MDMMLAALVSLQHAALQSKYVCLAKCSTVMCGTSDLGLGKHEHCWTQQRCWYDMRSHLNTMQDTIHTQTLLGPMFNTALPAPVNNTGSHHAK
jgi:hypothetical protein